MSSKIDYDEVLFELRDGTEYATLHADTFRAAMRERDMLRAEREVWANIAQERNDLRDEVERLQASNLASEIARANQRNDELWAGIEAVKTERDELRAEILRLTEENRKLKEQLASGKSVRTTD